MRKILLFLFFAGAIVSCKETAETHESTESEAVATAEDAEMQQTCTHVFILKNQSLPAGWDTNIIICEQTADKIKVSLENLSQANKVNWLQRFGKHIDYSETYPYIEKARTLTGDVNYNNAQYTNFDLATLKSRLQTAGGNFDNDNYTNFVRLVVDSTGNGSMSISKDYVSDANTATFTIPFFRSIISQHKTELGTNPEFIFAKVNVDGNARVVLRVRKANSTMLNYNYTDDPGRGNPI